MTQSRPCRSTKYFEPHVARQEFVETAGVLRLSCEVIGYTCHRSFSLHREAIEFRLEHEAVCLERDITVFARHEHRLSIQKQAS